MRYRFIEVEKASYPIALMCRILQVSRGGYYAWRTRPESARSRSDRKLLVDIRTAHKASRRTYGSPRMQRELLAQGHSVGRHRVARLMRLDGLRGRRRRRFRTTTQSNHAHPVAANQLERQFAVETPNQAWVTDITYGAPNPWRRPGRRCQGLSMSGMHSDFHKDEGRGMPAICYEVARAEAAVTCRTLAG